MLGGESDNPYHAPIGPECPVMYRYRHGIVVVLALLLLLVGCRGHQDDAGILSSLKQVDEYPLYVMHFEGSYKETAPMDVRPSRFSSSEQFAPSRWACSLFASLADPESSLFGRNFDWRYSPALLLFTDPPDGYASVTMVDIEYLGFERVGAQKLTELSLEERLPLLNAPHWPFDGMNEHGLAIGMAAVPHADRPTDPGKQTIGSLQAIRKMLDHAKNVDEAIKLLDEYNIDMSGGPTIHYLIADASGRAALIEFNQGEMVILPNETLWHQATNFLRSAHKESAQGECERYDRISAFLSNAEGKITEQEALALLSNVSQDLTQWSVVYEMSTGDVNVVMGQEWDNVHIFHLDRTAP